MTGDNALSPGRDNELLRLPIQKNMQEGPRVQERRQDPSVIEEAVNAEVRP